MSWAPGAGRQSVSPRYAVGRGGRGLRTRSLRRGPVPRGSTWCRPQSPTRYMAQGRARHSDPRAIARGTCPSHKLVRDRATRAETRARAAASMRRVRTRRNPCTTQARCARQAADQADTIRLGANKNLSLTRTCMGQGHQGGTPGAPGCAIRPRAAPDTGQAEGAPP
jgi:hypothetical protein